MPIEIITDAIIDVINKNMIAKTNVSSDITIGDTVIEVVNSFQFADGQEIILVDTGWGVPGSVHYNIFEYAKVSEVNNTTSITLTDPVEGNWLTADNAYIQKTIGHAPLWENNVFYGDREVIPFDQMAVAIEPVSLSNEWIYLQGGLDEEYRLKILIYGRDIKFEEGRRILDRYSDAIYQLLLNNIHLEIDNYHTPLTANYTASSSTVVIEHTPENVANITVNAATDPFDYQMQDNEGASCWFHVDSISIGGGNMTLTVSPTYDSDFNMADFAILKKWHRTEYIYDSRVDGVTYGTVSKGGAFLRASDMNWFGKKVNEHIFPQTSNRVTGRA